MTRLTNGRAPSPWMGLALGSSLAAATVGGDAHATGSLSSHDHHVVDERIALSIGPGRTSLWVQLRIDTDSLAVAVVVPARPGASLDWASDGFIEALEAATAPRVLPPPGEPAFCPEHAPPADPVAVAGVLVHESPLATSASPVVLDDAAAVVAWAQANGMHISGGLALALAGLADHRFVVARFDAMDAEVLTPTLRVSGPDVSPVLPLVLTEAGDRAVRVTSWILGEGRAAVDGAPGLGLDAIGVTYDAALGESDYAAESLAALSLLGPSGWLLESASHRALAAPLTLDGGHTLESVASEYTARAAVYAGDFDAAVCLGQLTPVLASDRRVGRSCARGELGVVGGTSPCVESAAPEEIDPLALRCGATADDLAVALSELSPSEVWLTRITLHVPQHAMGAATSVSIASGPPVEPVLTATHVDASGCADGGGGGAGGEEPGAGGAGAAGGGGRRTVRVPVYDRERGCGSPAAGVIVDFEDVVIGESEEPPDAIYVDDSDCGGDAADSYAVSYDETPEETSDDSCTGDTTSSYETWETYETTYSPGDTSSGSESDDACGGDTSSSYDDSSGDDCGGDTTTSYETTETTEWYDDDSGDTDSSQSETESDCGGDSYESYETTTSYDDDDDDSSSDDGCSSDTSESSSGTEEWEARRRPLRSRLRLSKVTLGAAFFLFPLRRLSRRRRRKRR